MARAQGARQQRQPERRRSIGAAAEDAVLLVDRREEVLELADILRRAEEEMPVRPQRVVEGGITWFCTSPAEIDQQVAAGDEVDAREGRIADDAVRREDAEIPDLLRDDVAGPSEWKKRARRSG
jgi:hypothetical protein